MLLPLLLVVGVAGGTFAYFTLKERARAADEEECVACSVEATLEVGLVAHPLCDLEAEDDTEEDTLAKPQAKKEQKTSYSPDSLLKPNFKEPIFEDVEAEKELLKQQQEELSKPLSPMSFDRLFSALWSGRDRAPKAVDSPTKTNSARRQICSPRVQVEQPQKSTPTRRRRQLATEHVLVLA